MNRGPVRHLAWRRVVEVCLVMGLGGLCWAASGCQKDRQPEATAAPAALGAAPVKPPAAAAAAAPAGAPERKPEELPEGDPRAPDPGPRGVTVRRPVVRVVGARIGGAGGARIGAGVRVGAGIRLTPQRLTVKPLATPAVVVAAAPAPRPRLDPNARYATTYRPGGASLAAFDAALSRGAIPAVHRDLVGDFAGRYAPALAPPAEGAMAFEVATERAQLGPGGGPLHVRVAMRSSVAMPTRAPLSVHLVLDVSGSMEGAAIAHARRAAADLVQRLDPSDHFSLVTFSSEAGLLVPRGPVGPRRAMIARSIGGVEAGGGTDISAGLDAGYAQAVAPGGPADSVKIVMLLSDGHANGGDTDARSLAARAARAFQEGVQTSTFGLGPSYDAPLMSGIADRGAGGYYYLADASQIAAALSRELDARLQPVASALEVRVRLRPDVTPTRVYGSRELNELESQAVRQQEVATDQQASRKDGIARDRRHDSRGGMRFFMPSFSRDDRHALLLALAVPAGVGNRPLGSVEIRYKDRLTRKNVTREMPLLIGHATSDSASAQTVNRSVVQTVQAFAAGEAILEAAERVDRGDRPGAARVLQERAELLQRAATLLETPSLQQDGQRLGRLAQAIGGTERVADAMPLAVLLRGAGHGYLR